MIAHLTVFRTNRTVLATGIVFAASGFLFGTWAALIPFIKEKFGLDDAQLGFLLLSLPAGVTLMNPVSVPILHRLGTVNTTVISHAVAAILFLFPIVLPSVGLTALALFVAGASYTVLNIAMNTCATQLEQRNGFYIMATCHGLWSAGAMSGSALAGMATGWGLPAIQYVGIIVVLQLILGQMLRKPLAGVPDEPHVPQTGEKKKSIFIWPNKALWILISISMCVNLTEGTMSDWSAVYMREVLNSPETLTGWGFAVYAFFMATGRLLGDSLIARFGSRKLLQTGGILAGTGLLLALISPGMIPVMVGFACIGAGVSVGAPILYAASAKVPGLPKGAGLATMNTFAMMAFLGGPALIGVVSHAFTLPVAFGVVALASIVWIVQVRNIQS